MAGCLQIPATIDNLLGRIQTSILFLANSLLNFHITLTAGIHLI